MPRNDASIWRASSPITSLIVGIVRTITAFYAAASSDRYQKVLAYSTVSQLGHGCGVGA